MIEAHLQLQQISQKPAINENLNFFICNSKPTVSIIREVGGLGSGSQG